MADEKESLVQTVKRNITPETDTSRSALPAEERLSADKSPQQEGEQLYDETFGSPAQQAYGKMKNWMTTHEQHFSDKVLKPFREGLDRMGDDLVEKGLDTHIPILAAAGGALKAVPVGKDVKETAAALMVPPEVGEENVLGKSLDKLSKEVHPTVAHIAASETEPAMAVLTDATGKKIGQAKWTKQGDEAHLNGIYVDTPHVGHGKMLLDEVANKAKESGAKGLTVGKVNSASPDAIGLFDRHTAHPVETIQSPVKGSQSRRINIEEGAKPKATVKTNFSEVKPDKETGKPYGQILVTLHTPQDREVGSLLMGLTGDGKAHINDSGIESGQGMPNEKSIYRNKGFGRQMYVEAINKAKEAGATTITSGGATSPEAARVWRSLSKEYPVIESKRGPEPYFSIDLGGGKSSPKDTIEKAGLKYKGELTPGSGVHQFEHPDHPGKTAALKESQITPEGVRTKMDSKLKEFEAADKMKSEAKSKGSEAL